MRRLLTDFVAMVAIISIGACAPSCAADWSAKPVRVILVGDSTMAPRNGYGDALCQRFTTQIACLNLAKNGRSSGSYRAEGSWDIVRSMLAENAAYSATYVLIQFGHNDQPGKPGRSTDLKNEFPANMAGYVRDVKAAGATPVLVTPLTRRTFQDKMLRNDLQPWADASRAVAQAEGVALIDLLSASAAAVQSMGQAEADTLAVEPPPAPAGVSVAKTSDLNQIETTSPAKSAFDRTHLGVKGARLFSRMVARLLVAEIPELATQLKPAGDAE